MGGGLVRTGEIERVEVLGKSESQSFQGHRKVAGSNAHGDPSVTSNTCTGGSMLAS